MKAARKIELSALKGRLKEEGITYRELSKDIELSLNALNSKINGYTPFTLSEAAKIIERLDIHHDDVVKYFFPSMLQNATKGRFKN